MSNKSDEMRKEWGTNDAKRDSELSTPNDIIRYDNIVYGEDTEWNILDVYKRKDDKGITPVIIIVHGGGWVYGTKETYQFYGMSLAERGFAVINYTYRLAPENKFPVQLYDTNNVINWMFVNADKYGLDINNVFMVGDSAGAHLLGLYCAICTDKNYAKNYSFKVHEGFVPKGIGMNCGAYKLYNKDGSLANGAVDGELMCDLLPDDGSKEETKIINVVDHINPSFPPAYIMTAVGDFLIDQAVLLEDEYKKNNIKYISKIYGDKKNPLYHVFHVTVQEPLGQKCNDDECDFFKSLL